MKNGITMNQCGTIFHFYHIDSGKRRNGDLTKSTLKCTIHTKILSKRRRIWVKF